MNKKNIVPLTIVVLFICLSLKAFSSARDSINDPFDYNAFERAEEKYNALCRMAEQSSDADTVLHYSNKAIGFAKSNGINASVAWVHKGNGYLHAGQLSEALECFMQAAKLYNRTNNQVGVATAYIYMSSTYSSQGNHINAIDYLTKAVAIFREEKDSIRQASSLHNLAYEYAKLSKYDSALILYDQAEIIYTQLDYDSGIAYCRGNSGKVYAQLGALIKAEQNLLEAIDKLTAANDEYAVTDFMLEYANVLEKKQEISSAIQFARQSYQLATQNKINEFRRDAAYSLSQLYSSTKQYDSAYHFQSIYIECKDSIQNIKTVQRMADLRTEFEVAQKQAEVDLLEKKRTIQKVVIGALILVLLLAAGLIYTYYKNLIRTRKLNKELEDSKEELEAQQEELRNLNHIKDKFFSIISHDLRGPISSFSGISMMIKESIENDNKELLHEIADFTDQTVISISGLLENLLNWALSQQGRFPFEMEELNVEEEINEVVKYLSTVAISKNIHLELHMNEGLLIKADKNSFMTIIRNLLSNAFKFSHKNGIVKITSRATENKTVQITVEDEGIGIAPEKLQELFILKETKSTRGTEQEKGIGLGLTLVYEFVSLNHGEIQVNSTEGKGTCFMLNFPLHRQER